MAGWKAYGDSLASLIVAMHSHYQHTYSSYNYGRVSTSSTRLHYTSRNDSNDIMSDVMTVNVMVSVIDYIYILYA